jgi:1-acyl-sn-glycerol-3-phosphate acyltransferase
MIEAVKADQIHFRILLYIFAPLSIFKLMLAATSIFFNAIFVYTTVSILGRRNPLFRKMAYITTTFTGRVLCWCASIIWITTERPKVCYKKYLGPDWKPSYENPGSIVGNHSSWADTPITMSR